MTLNLDKNKSVLVHAWKEVLDERNPINWALFGYDGQTYDLNLVGKGDGGLEELIEDFNSGKIQYALCRVKIKEKNVEKILLVNWQGEGAPLARKGTCANHLENVKSFFKGVHVTINARTDEDVEPDLILQTVGKAIAGEGVKMSTIVEPDIGPVGTVYKRVNPQEEINAKAKDAFWRKEAHEEESRRRETVKTHRKFSQDEVKLLRKESQDYFDKEEQEQQELKHQPVKSNTTTPSPQPPQPAQNIGQNTQNGFSNGFGHGHQKSNSASPIPPQDRASVNAVTAAALQASMPMKSSSNSDLVRKRIKSFDGGSTGPVFPTNRNSATNLSPKVNGSGSGYTSLNNSSWAKSPSPGPTSMPVNCVNATTNGSSTPPAAKVDSVSVSRRKQMFEGGVSNNTTSGGTNTSNIQKRNPAEEIRQAQEEMRKQLEKEKEDKKKQKEIKKEVTPEVTPVSKSPPPPKQEEKKEEIVKSPVAHFQSNVIPTTIPPTKEEIRQEPAFFSNPTAPPPQKSPEIQIPIAKSPTPQPSPPAQFQNSPKEQRVFDNTVHSAQGLGSNVVREDVQVRSKSPAVASPVASPVPEGEMITIEITQEMGVCARALYDYQAADETEITFDPGDIIKNIEKIDEGWWEGLGPGDQYGLFPANYVELLN